jgi:AcrR family transcriptional regulator
MSEPARDDELSQAASKSKRLIAARRRAAILEASTRLFLRDGFERASMRRIAIEAGVSATSIYVYFRDKDELLGGIAEILFEEMRAQFERDGATVTAPLDRLVTFMRSYVTIGLQRPDAYRLVFMAERGAIPAGHKSTRGAEPELASPNLGIQIFAVLEQLVRQLIADSVFRQADPQATAESIWAMGHGLVALLLTHPNMPWSPLERLMETAFGVAFLGLLQRPPSEPQPRFSIGT